MTTAPTAAPTEAPTAAPTDAATEEPTEAPTGTGTGTGTGPTGPTGSGDCPAGRYNYAEVLEKSMLFYEAQRAGPLPDDQRVTWRGDSNLDDDPQGGYYDAGDFLKFGFPMAGMTTQLAWGAISFEYGYTNAGQLEYIKKTIQWATDYFIDANRLPSEFIGQIG